MSEQSLPLSEGEEKTYEELKRFLRPQYANESVTSDGLKGHLKHRKLIDQSEKKYMGGT